MEATSEWLSKLQEECQKTFQKSKRNIKFRSIFRKG